MTTFRYATVERALMHALKSQPVNRSALQARIHNLRRFGIPIAAAARPGKGRAFEYTYHQIVMLLLALVLDSWRSKPQKVSAAVKRHWPKIADGIRRVRAGEDIVLRAAPNFSFNGRDLLPMECVTRAEFEATLEATLIEAAAEGRCVEFLGLNAWLRVLDEGLTR
jgi:hypothetical protein